MGNAVIGGQLHHFGVHHDEAHLVGGGLIQQADDQRIGTHGLTGTGGTGDQHMGQPGDIAHDGAAADVLTHGEGHGAGMVGKLPALDHVPDTDGGDSLVGHLDAHGGDLAGDRCDTHAGSAQRQSDIIAEIGELAELHALIQCELIAGDAGAVDDLAGMSVYPEGGQRRRQPLGVEPQLRAHLLMVVVGIFIQQRDGRVAVGSLPLGQLLFDGLADLGGGAFHLRPDGFLPLLLRQRLLDRCGSRRRFRLGRRRRFRRSQRGIQQLRRGLYVAGAAGEQTLAGRLQCGGLAAGLSRRFVVQRNVDIGSPFSGSRCNGRFLYRLCRTGGCFLLVVIVVVLVLPPGAFLGPALHLRRQLGRLDLQRAQHRQQRQQNGQDQGHHAAEQRLHGHRQQTGHHAAAQQGLAVLPHGLDVLQ